jgi:zinc-finger-containing domain
MTATEERLTKPRVIVAPVCPYCGQDAELTDKHFVAAHGCEGLVWWCRPCKAWAKAYPNSPTHKPMGRLANHALRVLHIRAWFEFRDVWQAFNWTQHKAQLWLAGELGIQPQYCQIGFFDEVMSQRVIDLCSAVGKKVAA